MRFVALLVLLASFTFAVNHYSALVHRQGAGRPSFHGAMLLAHAILGTTLAWLILGGL